MYLAARFDELLASVRTGTVQYEDELGGFRHQIVWQQRTYAVKDTESGPTR